MPVHCKDIRVTRFPWRWLRARTISASAIAVLLFGGLACSNSNEPQSAGPTGLIGSSETSAQKLQFLPYGVAAPDTIPLNTVPQPYDPEKHGPPLPNQIPHLNLANIPGLGTTVPGRHQEASAGTKVALSGAQTSSFFDTERGLFWESDTDRGYTGVHDTELDLEIPHSSSADRVVFAPTALPSGRACIEVATTHRRFPQDVSDTAHHLGWWNWCDPQGAPVAAEVEEDMESLVWQDYYSVIWAYNGEPGYYIQIVPDDSQGYPCWNGLIYNFGLGYWESKLYSCWPNGHDGNWTGEGNKGWSFWEAEEIEKICPPLAGTGAHHLRTMDANGNWRNINQVAPSLSDGTFCWDDAGEIDWTMYYPQDVAYSHWIANTPFD